MPAKTNPHTELGEKMYRIRTFLGLKQADIAFGMDDISPAAYGKLERGEVRSPSIKRLEQFADITGIPLNDFLQKGPDELIQQLIETRR
jgi:transcriptional regulator with XRE-family HTH domain